MYIYMYVCVYIYIHSDFFVNCPLLIPLYNSAVR